MLNRDFIIGYKVMISSLLDKNQWFDHEVVILDLDLTPSDKTDILDLYENTTFIKPKIKNYSRVNFERTAEKLRATYYKLDVFRLDYDRIVFIDSDVVVVGDLSELFNCSLDFAAVKGYNARLDEMRADINSGVFVVNKRFLNDETYTALVQMAEHGHSMPDQKVINSYFKGQIAYFNKGFNVEKRMISTVRFRKVLENMRIIHYVASKPWMEDREEGFDELEKYWFEAYEKLKNKDK
jgi:lipopolysaccharide biosynthesis glycosyltransferase